MKLTLEIELGNDAMRTPADAINAIVASLSRPLTYAPFSDRDTGIVHDTNGNTVGTWAVGP